MKVKNQQMFSLKSENGKQLKSAKTFEVSADILENSENEKIAEIS